MIREAWEDPVLQVPNPDGQEGSASVAVPKGTHIVVDVVGVRQYTGCITQDQLLT